MRSWLVPRTLRARVTLWYTAMLLCGLAAYAAVVYVSLARVMWAELDDRLHHEIETVEGLLQPYWTATGPQTPTGASPLDDDDDRWLQVWSADGQLLFESDRARTAPLPGVAPPEADGSVSVISESGERVRVRDEHGHIARHPVVVRAVTEESRVRAALAQMLVLMVAALPIAAGLVGLGGYYLARRTLSPVSRLVDATNAVTAANLDARLPVEVPHDEVGQIARAFNATLARLEGSFAQMERFTANASHELRTPLTALQSVGQVALTDADTVDEYRDAVGSILEEARHLSQLLDLLLLLARSDAGQIALTTQPVHVLDVVGDVVTECRVLADEKAQHVELGGDDVTIAADPTVLRIALANLLHNAIRYSPEGGAIRIRVSAGAAGATVAVTDSGPGIPPEHLERIFERFYRIDAGRSPAAGGVGLGLAMAQWAVTAHGGRIEVANHPSGGSTFTITLPAAPGSDLNV